MMGVKVRQHDDHYWEVVSYCARAGLLFGSQIRALQAAGVWARESHAEVTVLEADGGALICQFD